MEDVLKNIDAEKRDRIINSALEEFSTNSFAKASTNNIVQKAGISKGLLYHYFKSKKGLYQYLKEFAIETMAQAIREGLVWEETDLLKRLKQIGLIKFKVCLKYPNLVAFSNRIYQNMSIEEIKESVEEHIPGIYQQVYTLNIDFSLFKDNIDIQKAINMTQWTMEKLAELWTIQRLAQVEVGFEGLLQEMDAYLVMLRNAFYKE